MTQEHPITPPPEIVREWQIKIEYCSKRADREALVAKIFQLGADMELEACCECINDLAHGADVILADLRAARRPKLPSLKEQALALLNDASDRLDAAHENTIRRALESLPD